MLTCPACGQKRIFTQVQRGMSRSLVFTPSTNGSISEQRSSWSEGTHNLPEGFFCGRCYDEIRSPESLLNLLKSEDPPRLIHSGTKEAKIAPIVNELVRTFPRAQINVHWRPLVSRTARYQRMDHTKLGIPKIVLDRIERAHNIREDDYYTHQVEAVTAALNGENVVIQTSTASGKTQCYLIPVFSELIKNPNSTALFMFPTKALSYDQIIKITSIGETFRREDLGPESNLYRAFVGGSEIIVGKYDRDTETEKEKGDIREKARILVTNPDALHFKILPHLRTSAGSFERFFRNLRFVVLDEIHVYRGAFGANVALLMRRLRMLCERLGNRQIQFICCSATLPNPKDHAQTLVGLPFAHVTNDGAAQYPKAFLLWNPTSSAKNSDKRLEPSTEAVRALAGVILRGGSPLRTITFIQSLGGVQRFDQLLKRELENARSGLRNSTATFSSRSHRAERLRIQDKLVSGGIIHVAATSALELGIDIGDLACCFIIGYPGTMFSVLQEAGRVGRKGESLVVIMLKDEPFQQFFARSPNSFWEALEYSELPKVPIDNRYLVKSHLLCATWEGRQVGGYSETDFKSLNSSSVDTLRNLQEEGLPLYIAVRGGQRFWLLGRGAPSMGDIYHNIRDPISEGKFDVIRRDTREKVGECDSALVPRDLHTNAMWINNGRFYLSTEVDYETRTAFVNYLGDEARYYTIALPENIIELKGPDIKSGEFNGFSTHYCRINLTRRVSEYREVEFTGTEEKLGPIKKTNTQDIRYDTDTMRIIFKPDFVKDFSKRTNWKEKPEDVFAVALHGLEHAARSVVPIISDFDPHDVSSEYISKDPNSSDSPALYLFDTFAGGLGLAQFCFENLPSILRKARELLMSCSCGSGCPRCVFTTWCRERNEMLNKALTITLIDALIQEYK